MVFSNTVTDIIDLGNGMIMERGVFDGDSVTTGTITADVTGVFSVGAKEITEIIEWGFASDGDTAILPAKDVAVNKIKITFTGSDTGDYYIKGFAK